MQTLAVGLRTAELYRPDNTVLLRAVQRFGATLGRCLISGPVVLSLRNRCFFANGKRVRLASSDYPRFLYLLQLLDDWGICGFYFTELPSETELARFFAVVAQDRGNPPDILEERLETAGMSFVELVLPEDLESATSTAASTKRRQVQAEATPSGLPLTHEAGGRPPRSEAAAVYVKAATVLRDTDRAIRAGEEVKARRLRRMTQAIVDQALRDPRSLLALSTIKDHDVYLVSHATNVAILSALLGQRLGLTKSQLGELALAAFLHDIGKTELPEEIVRKPGPLSENEWRSMRTHPQLGAKVIMRELQLAPATLRAARVAYEHHIDYDKTGYPNVHGAGDQSLFARIVAICDRYDALTTFRPYRRRNFTPAEALAFLIQQAGKGLDPVVLRYFVEMMGTYPVGTVVRLNTGDVAVVCAPPEQGKPLNRPFVRLLESGKTLDLSQTDTSGTYYYEITEILNPDNVGQIPVTEPEALSLD